MAGRRPAVTLVIDASVVLASLVDGTAKGDWAKDLMLGETLAAPHLLPAETASALRIAGLAGSLSGVLVASAYRDLVQLSVEYFAFEPYAERVWQLRANVSPYDAWYVALAEDLGSNLATLDRRFAVSPGPTCIFDLPPV
jgi:predicted nucleic acid-binding protein